MKIASSILAATLLFSGAAWAQTFTQGQKVEAPNPTTGKTESATIIRIDGGRYLLHSDNAAISDWDVAASEIRVSGSTTNAPPGNSPASNPPAAENPTPPPPRPE